MEKCLGLTLALLDFRLGLGTVLSMFCVAGRHIPDTCNLKEQRVILAHSLVHGSLAPRQEGIVEGSAHIIVARKPRGRKELRKADTPLQVRSPGTSFLQPDPAS